VPTDGKATGANTVTAVERDNMQDHYVRHIRVVVLWLICYWPLAEVGTFIALARTVFLAMIRVMRKSLVEKNLLLLLPEVIL